MAGLTGVMSHLRQVGAGELRRLCRSDVVRRSVVVVKMVACWGLLGLVGQLLLQVASSERYQHKISCDMRNCHLLGGKVRGLLCILAWIS